MPDELVRGFIASDWLDTIHGRVHRLRMVFTLLLVAMPRASALVSRDVGHFHESDGRIDFGAGRGKKGRGQGRLDAITAAELKAYIGSRQDGALLLSPEGGRIGVKYLLRWWKEAFSLGLVWELWPRHTAWSVDLAYLVSCALLSGCREASSLRGASRCDSLGACTREAA